jgi:hypothetical protein
MPDIPQKFKWPFRRTPEGDRVDLTSQDNPSHVDACGQVTIRTPVGWFDDFPEFGWPFPEFVNIPVDPAPVLQALKQFGHPAGSYTAEEYADAIQAAVRFVDILQTVDTEGAPDYTATGDNRVAPLHVDRNIIRTPGGQRYVFRGATAWMLPMFGPWPDFLANANNMYAKRDAIFQYMRSLGLNSVRIGVAPDSLLIGDDGDIGTWLEQAAGIVDSAKSHGLITIFTFWTGDGNVPDLTNGDFDTFLSAAGRIFGKVGEDPWVIYNPYNEPHDITNEQWQDMQEQILDYYRGTLGYKGILLLDTQAFAWEFESHLAEIEAVLAYSDQFAVPRNICWSNHRYAQAGDAIFLSSTGFSNVGNFEGEVGRYILDYPILGTEWGWETGAGTSSAQWSQEAMDYVATELVPRGFNGLLGFIWAWVDNSLTTAESGNGSDTVAALTTLTEWGGIFRDDYLKKVSSDEPTPSADWLPATWTEPPTADSGERADTGPPPGPGWNGPARSGWPGVVIDTNEFAAEDNVNGWGSTYWLEPVQHPAMAITLSTWVSGAFHFMFGLKDPGEATMTGYNMVISPADDTISVYRLDPGGDVFIRNWSVTQTDGDTYGIQRIGPWVGVWHRPVGGDWVLLDAMFDPELEAEATDHVGFSFDFGGDPTNRAVNFQLMELAQ